MPESVFIIVAYFNVSMFGMELAGRVLPNTPAYAKAFSTKDCGGKLEAARRSLNANSIKPTRVVCERLEIVK